MFENFIITDHVVERYYERVSNDRKEIIRRIKRDLSIKRVKRIVNNGNIRHVFTFNSKEFIFEKTRDVWILKTVIKRTRNNNKNAINKRIKTAV